MVPPVVLLLVWDVLWWCLFVLRMSCLSLERCLPFLLTSPPSLPRCGSVDPVCLVVVP